MADDAQRGTRRPGRAKALMVDGLPTCTIQTSDDGTWHVTTQLATEQQDTLATSVPSPQALCQRAQHALGLAGIGSRIEDDYTAVGVYAASVSSSSGQFLLMLDGRALLFSIAQAPSESIQALMAAAVAVMRTAYAA